MSLLPSCHLEEGHLHAGRLEAPACRSTLCPSLQGLCAAPTHGLEALRDVAKGHVDGGADAQGQGPRDADLAGLAAGVQQLVGEVGVGHRCDLLPDPDAVLQVQVDTTCCAGAGELRSRADVE